MLDALFAGLRTVITAPEGVTWYYLCRSRVLLITLLLQLSLLVTCIISLPSEILTYKLYCTCFT